MDGCVAFVGNQQQEPLQKVAVRRYGAMQQVRRKAKASAALILI